MWDQRNLVEPMFKIVDTILISTNEKEIVLERVCC